MTEKLKNGQKKGTNPDFSFISWGIGSYMLFRLAKSDVIGHSHKYSIPNDATFSIVARLFFIIQHQ